MKKENVKKIEQSDFEHFKKIKGTEKSSSQVVRNPMQKHGSFCDLTITDTLSVVNNNFI